MDSAMFNTSDTNYLEIDQKSDLGLAANQAIDDVVKKNNEQYRRNAQMAIQLASQKSQNFQKLGSLIKQAADFSVQAREWNDTREQLKARKNLAEKAEKEHKNQNTKLYNEAIDKSGTLFNYQEGTTTQFPTDKALGSADAKYAELAKESNAAYKEGVNLAFEAEKNYKLTDNLDNAELGIKLFETATVEDFQTKGAALTSQIAKGYEGYLAAVQDIKVPTKYGMLSLQDVQSRANKDPAKYDAVVEFHQGSYYWQAGVFGGKNALSQRQQIALLKLTDATDKTARSVFIKDSFQRAKEDYVKARQNNLADAIKGTAGDPSGDSLREVFFGSKDDPNSGYIAKYEAISGEKDVAGAIEMLESDLRKLAENRSLKSEDLARIINIKGIDARDGSGKKTLKEFNEGLHSRLEGLLGQVSKEEVREKEAKDIQTITGKVEAATERLNKLATGATEDDLKAEVKQIKQELRDSGIDVSDNSLYYKYFQPLLNYHTKDDAYDEATTELAEFAVDQGNFKSAQDLINTIRDPEAKKKAQEYYDGREPIKNNKTKYDQVKNKLDDYIKKAKDVTSTNMLGDIETNTILNNAGDHFNEIFLAEMKKKVPVSLALETAFTAVKKNLDKPSETNLKGEDDPGFGEYYISGAGRFYNEEAQGGLEFNTANAAYEAGKTLANPDTKNDWLNSKTPHYLEPVNELIQYTNGGPIPSYYIEASKHLRFTTAQDLMYSRLKALGYDKESGLIQDGSALDSFTRTAELKKLFTYHPNPTKTNRVLFEFGSEEFNRFFNTFVRKTKDDQFGNKSHKNKELLDFENIPINDSLNAHAKDGYGYNGFGPYKLEPAMIRRLEKASGLDFSKDTLSLENQRHLIVTKNLVEAGIDNFFSTGSYWNPILNSFDMQGMFDEGSDPHNLPFLLSPELMDTYFEEII